MKCSNCKKPLTRPESIIRGMGPICYGKSYTYKRLMKEGLSREEILKIPEEEILNWAKEVVKKVQKKKNKKGSLRVSKKPKNHKKDKYQLTLDVFFNSGENKEANN